MVLAALIVIYSGFRIPKKPCQDTDNRVGFLKITQKEGGASGEDRHGGGRQSFFIFSYRAQLSLYYMILIRT